MRFSSSPILERTIPFAILTVLGILWGGVPSIAKYVVLNGVHPLSYSFWILTIAASTLFVINIVRTRRLPPRYLSFYTICGLSGSAVPTTCMYYSVTAIPASLMAILIAIAPMFTFLVALKFRAESYHHLKTLGLILAFGGVLLILMPNSVAALESSISWILFAILTPVMYAINTVYTALKRPADLHIVDMSVGMLIASAIFLFFVSMAAAPFFPLWQAEPVIMGLMLYHGVLTATAFCLFYTLLKMSGPLFSSQVTYFATVMGIAFGFVMHNEVLPIAVWVATGVMFAGIGFIQKARRLTRESRSGA